jgi:hypothetical protein
MIEDFITQTNWGMSQIYFNYFNGPGKANVWKLVKDTLILHSIKVFKTEKGTEKEQVINI